MVRGGTFNPADSFKNDFVSAVHWNTHFCAS